MHKLLAILLAAALLLCGCTGASALDEAAALAEMQEKISTVDFFNLFGLNFDENSCQDNGLGFYSAAYAILGEQLEATYQYLPRPEFGEESYPYTPAAVIDSALQQYFTIPVESFHAMISAYDSEIDGYWVPMGLGGLSVKTVINSYEIDQNSAILQCTTRSSAWTEGDPITISTVIVNYSTEHGWRFSSCTVD